MAQPLTPEEDAELRRLYALGEYADVAPSVIERFRELRDRDRRASVRPVGQEHLLSLVPTQQQPADEVYPAEP